MVFPWKKLDSITPMHPDRNRRFACPLPMQPYTMCARERTGRPDPQREVYTMRKSSPIPSNIVTEDRERRARTSKLVRSRVRPPEMIPNLRVIAFGTIPELAARVETIHRYVGTRRPFTELEQTELKILYHKLTFQKMLKRVGR